MLQNKIWRINLMVFLLIDYINLKKLYDKNILLPDLSQ